MRRCIPGVLLIFAFPLVMVANVFAYARLQRGWMAKVGMFVTFLPVIAITSLIWFGCWALGFGFAALIWR